jgi:hypothetical protein
MYALSSNIFGSTQMLIGKKQESTDRDFQESTIHEEFAFSF